MIEKRITKNKHKRSKIQNRPPIERENSFLPEFHPLSHNIFEIVAANRFVISQTAILICKSVICTEIGSAPPMETPDALPLYEKRAGDGWRKSCPFGRNRKRERERGDFSTSDASKFPRFRFEGRQIGRICHRLPGRRIDVSPTRSSQNWKTWFDPNNCPSEHPRWVNLNCSEFEMISKSYGGCITKRWFYLLSHPYSACTCFVTIN